ncbi:7845_t:CDS:2, partial [Cetraspora pellucida]
KKERDAVRNKNYNRIAEKEIMDILSNNDLNQRCSSESAMMKGIEETSIVLQPRDDMVNMSKQKTKHTKKSSIIDVTPENVTPETPKNIIDNQQKETSKNRRNDSPKDNPVPPRVLRSRN